MTSCIGGEGIVQEMRDWGSVSYFVDFSVHSFHAFLVIDVAFSFRPFFSGALDAVLHFAPCTSNVLDDPLHFLSSFVPCSSCVFDHLLLFRLRVFDFFIRFLCPFLPFASCFLDTFLSSNS